jgi:hypothetical protein
MKNHSHLPACKLCRPRTHGRTDTAMNLYWALLHLHKRKPLPLPSCMKPPANLHGIVCKAGKG